MPLDPVRGAAPSGPAVSFIGCAAHPESTGGPTTCGRPRPLTWPPPSARPSTDGWAVRDDKTGDWRPARWSDVAVLLPARTSLRALERALERDGIPYRAETSSLVYGTGEIRDLLMVARAVEDPTDSLAVVAALRTAAFGCGDDDLYVWRHTHGGRWDHQRPCRDGAGRAHRRPGPLVAGRRCTGSGCGCRPARSSSASCGNAGSWRWRSCTPGPGTCGAGCGSSSTSAGPGRRPAARRCGSIWRGSSLQSAEGARVIETVLPETDDEAVRILTVHGAKGLEFPITVLSGMTTQLNRRRAGSRCSSLRPALGAAAEEGPGDRRVHRVPAHRRTDGPPRASPPPLRGRHPGP